MYTVFFISVFSLVLVWTAGLADWIVAFQTGLTQLGIWVTVLSLVPFRTLWVSAKTRNATDAQNVMTEQTYYSSLFSK